MALPATGAISFAALQTEFARGGANPISLAEYYKTSTTTYVVGSDTAPNVPASGVISLDNFHGATKLSIYSNPLTGVFTGSTKAFTGVLRITGAVDMYSFDSGTCWSIVDYSVNSGGSWINADTYEFSAMDDSTSYNPNVSIPLTVAPNSLRVRWNVGSDGWGGSYAYLYANSEWFE